MHAAAIKRRREVSRGILAYHGLDPSQRSVHAVSLPQADICYGRLKLADTLLTLRTYDPHSDG